MNKGHTFNTTFAKTAIAIVITTIVVLMAVGIFSFYEVNKNFDKFLHQQEEEFLRQDQLLEAYIEEAEHITQHTAMIQDFENTTLKAIIWASILGVVLSVVISLILSREITKPIAKLRKIISKVTQNKYKLRAPEEGSEEIKSLIVDFNRLLSELERIERLREDLVSDIAHELKTPLTKIQGQVEGIIDGVYIADKAHLEKIMANVNQLCYLIERLQQIAQIKAGQENIKKSNVNLLDTVNEVASGYTKKDVKLSILIPKKIGIKADKYKFREILENLISNAFKYTEKGKITIKGNKETLSIQDTGMGIPSKDLPYIFERFFRVERSRSKKTGGFGLGLSIAKDLVEAHGWKIRVESWVNKGTKFVIIFE